MSSRASLDPTVGCLGGGRNQEFLAHESHFNTSTESNLLLLFSWPFCSFSLHPLSVAEEKEKETTDLSPSETLLSNSHQPCVNPQGDRENSKHRSTAKNKKCTTVRPSSAACLLCKGPTGCQSRRRLSG